MNSLNSCRRTVALHVHHGDVVSRSHFCNQLGYHHIYIYIHIIIYTVYILVVSKNDYTYFFKYICIYIYIYTHVYNIYIYIHTYIVCVCDLSLSLYLKICDTVANTVVNTCPPRIFLGPRRVELASALDCLESEASR